jgi:hypothetical protein
LQIQAKVRQVNKNLSNPDRQVIQTEREELTALIVQLKQAQQVAGVVDTNISSRTESEFVDLWDDLINDLVPTIPENTPALPQSTQNLLAVPQSTSASSGPVPIEKILLGLPSNKNVTDDHRELELAHRISQAEQQLNDIRNVVAEKSFQYSHVIRVAPRKAVATRSRAVIKKLNNQIAGHSRLYSKCRSSLVTLGAYASTLTRFKVLTLEDVRASTAVLNPNEPGSTRIKLPWIWQTSASNRLGLIGSHAGEINTGQSTNGLNSMFECVYISSHSIFYIDSSTVQRIHWLRARAQLMRWQEEATLTTYEMQWTVRYFAHNSGMWNRVQDTRAGTGAGAGAIAYAKRKKSTWEQLSYKSDRTFTLLNPAYKSPL